MISDAHAGLKAAIAQQFQHAAWQRCRVHVMGNLHGAVATAHKPVATATAQTVFALTEPDEIAAR